MTILPSSSTAKNMVVGCFVSSSVTAISWLVDETGKNEEALFDNDELGNELLLRTRYE